MKNPRGYEYTFTYTSDGRLYDDHDPAGGSKRLTRTNTAHGYRVDLLGMTGVGPVQLRVGASQARKRGARVGA